MAMLFRDLAKRLMKMRRDHQQGFVMAGLEGDVGRYGPEAELDAKVEEDSEN